MKQKTDLSNDFTIQLPTKIHIVSIKTNNQLMILQRILNSSAAGSKSLLFQDCPCK